MKPVGAFMPYPSVQMANAEDGILSGLKFAVKDLFDVSGYPTSSGQPMVLAMSGVKTTTAPVVQTLLDFGAQFVGKTVTDELAFSLNGQNAHFGSPVNGACADRISGGSSSGSASAVSLNLVDFALGTDTGGSIRAPASHCGLIGIRPTHGLVSLEGVTDLAPSLDTCGWFARDFSVFNRVARAVLGVGKNEHEQTSPRLYLLDSIWKLLASEALEALKIPLSDIGEQVQILRSFDIVSRYSLDDLYWSFRYIQGYEAWRVHGSFIEEHNPVLGPGVKERFEWSRQVTQDQFKWATQLRAEFQRFLSDMLGDTGYLIIPTMPDVAPLKSCKEAALDVYRNNAIRMLCIAGLAGFPQVSLPLARRLGAPFGISLIGPKGRDVELIRLCFCLTSS